MTKILFLDLDGTVRQTKSGATFITDPYDQELIPGVVDALENYKDWTIIGITNQGGVAAGFKTLENCILEQQQTLTLITKLHSIYFCPDNGDTIGIVERSRNGMFTSYQDGHSGVYASFRKPDCGMIIYACGGKFTCDVAIKDLYSECLMVGDRPEDQQCAANAKIPFMWAEDWRK